MEVALTWSGGAQANPKIGKLYDLHDRLVFVSTEATLSLNFERAFWGAENI